jgi:hypothetical protein
MQEFPIHFESCLERGSRAEYAPRGAAWTTLVP